MSATRMNKDAGAESNNHNKPRLSVENPYLKKPPAKRSLLEISTSGATIDSSSVASLPAPVSQPQHAQQQQKQEQTLKPAAQQQPSFIEKQTFGEKEPTVERLPSRNVSFGSAEILTVSELHTNAASFISRSVRITGVVAHRHIGNDGNVCLVLKDPSIIKTKQQQAPRSILKTPGIQRRRTSLGLKTPRLVTRKRPMSSSLLLKKKPPIKLNPLDAIVNSLVNEQTILVYANSKQLPVNAVCNGDLCMIIGQVCSTTSSVEAVQPIMSKCKEKSNSSTQMFVNARILKNVNGTDMRLHNEALKMRRKHLAEQTTEPDNETGLGPLSNTSRNDDGRELIV